MSDSNNQNNPLEGLTGKQKAFVRAYVGEAKGNATEAARIAGYGGKQPEDSYLARVGSENVRKCKVSEAIEAYRQHLNDQNPNFLSPEQIHEFWHSVVTDPNQSMRDRLSASKMAARSQALFVEKIQHEHKGNASFVFSLNGETDDE